MAVSCNRGAAGLLPDIEGFFSGLSRLLIEGSAIISTGSYQTLDSAEFHERRLDEYERTLAILLSRITESYGHEQSVCSDLQELLQIVSSQRTFFERMSFFDDQEYPDVRNNTIIRTPWLSAEVSRNGNTGRPRFNIPEDCLHSLHDTLGLRWMDVARTLGVSDRTLRRRRQEFGMNTSQFSCIQDTQLNGIVAEILRSYPRAGFRMVAGILRSRGFNVQRRRIVESLRRVDPITSSLRSQRSILRRRYSVPHPNFMWHIDGNHKLVQPYRFVIHGAIVGYSRLITYLSASVNNKAETVLAHFISATEEFGLPSHVRCDFGLENILVGRFMIENRGINQNSIITGRSVRNQRIERLWRDLNQLVLSSFRNIFLYLESQTLDVDNELHLYALHVVYLPRINHALTEFSLGWNHHSISTMHNLSPRQLWMQGMISNAHRHYTSVDEIMQGHAEIWNTVGIDEGGPVPEQESDSILVVPQHTLQLSTEQNEELQGLLLPIDQDAHGIASFNAVLARLTTFFST